MIVVDSSVWIDFFKGEATPQTIVLRSLMGSELLLVGDVILCELLQGARDKGQAKVLQKALAQFEQVSMLGPALAVSAAAHYRALRSEGVTIRKTIDLIIGTFCIEKRHRLLHADRDFDPWERYLGLDVVPAQWQVHK